MSDTTVVECICDAHLNLMHFSATWTGLSALAQRGRVSLRIRRPSAGERSLTADPLTVCLRVLGPRGRRRLFAIDLRDQSDVFSTDLLERCDVYLKRSHFPPDVAALPDLLRAKVEPFGLNYACRTRASTRRLVRNHAAGLIRLGRAGLAQLYQFLVLPLVSEFEQAPDGPREPTILFQTRLWEPHDTAAGECESINGGRIALIRALKEEFGDRFRGGLVPNAFAMKWFPGDVSSHSTRRRQYAALVKRNLIGIYTRGLHQSTAFKLPEYLAASLCIVAEPPRNLEPAPLVAGTHYLPYATTEECVSACRRLLAEPELATNMRRANHQYYRKEVEPAAHISAILDRHLPA